ncbi:hypothetical protein [Ruminococcus flavefaciens]|uniref:hypothetical protein n=1 Tax=Ruminococcus flavefaciens TaxID=1265 RepID=UPI00048F9FFE|nr:hypothetical protein [Ruminococcus flavefaciens]
MKKSVFLLCIAAIMLTGCGGNKDNAAKKESNTGSTETTAANITEAVEENSNVIEELYIGMPKSEAEEVVKKYSFDFYDDSEDSSTEYGYVAYISKSDSPESIGLTDKFYDEEDRGHVLFMSFNNDELLCEYTLNVDTTPPDGTENRDDEGMKSVFREWGNILDKVYGPGEEIDSPSGFGVFLEKDWKDKNDEIVIKLSCGFQTSSMNTSRIKVGSNKTDQPLMEIERIK